MNISLSLIVVKSVFIFIDSGLASEPAPRNDHDRRFRSDGGGGFFRCLFKSTEAIDAVECRDFVAFG
jgi:hypothetical protein